MMNQVANVRVRMVPVRDVVSFYIGGGWGQGEPDPSHTEGGWVIRGTDLPGLLVGDVGNIPYRYHKVSNIKSRRLQTNDIVFEVSGGSKDQPVGRALLITDQVENRLGRDVICASFCKLIRPNVEEVDPRYLYYYFQHIYTTREITQFQVQSTGISNFKFEAFLDEQLVPLPPMATQRQIAGILSAYDDLIENNTRRIKILEEMAQALYREWFVHFRYPGHEHVPLVDSPAGPIPEGWEMRRIEEVCIRLQSGGTPARSEDRFWASGTVNWYKTGELHDQFLFGSEEKIAEVAITESSTRVFEAGTVLMAIYGSPTVGRMGILTSRSSCNQAALGLVANPKLVSQTLLFFALKELRDHFNSIAQGAAQQNISKTKVANSRLLLPCHDLISRFDLIVEPMLGGIQNLQHRNHTLSTMRDLLLPRLVSGQLQMADAVLDKEIDRLGLP